MQRETTNRDFPVNFRGIALTGGKTSQMIILLVRYSLTQHYTHSCKDLLFNARSNKSTSQQTQLDLSIFHIRLVSLRPLCLPLWASSCGCPKVFTTIPINQHHSHCLGYNFHDCYCRRPHDQQHLQLPQKLSCLSLVASLQHHHHCWGPSFHDCHCSWSVASEFWILKYHPVSA